MKSSRHRIHRVIRFSFSLEMLKIVFLRYVFRIIFFTFL